MLHAVIVLRATAVDRREQVIERPLAERFANEVIRDFSAFEHRFRDFIRSDRDAIEHLFAALLRLGQVLFRYGDGEELAERFVREVARDQFHLDQVDDAFERFILTRRDGDDHGVRTQLGFHLLDAGPEVRAHAVELVDVRQPRHLILGGLSPNGLGLDFDATLGAEHTDRAVEDAQRAFDFSGEVDVAGGVDDVDVDRVFVAVGPVDRHGGRVDRDPLLALERVEVRSGIAVVDVADFVFGAAVIQNPLGGSRFPRIHVGHDSDIAYVIEHRVGRSE